MKPTLFQTEVQRRIGEGKSVLVLAPTGLGKTFAATGDLAWRDAKVIYAVPLRALAGSIRDEITDLGAQQQVRAVIHHGDLQESQLFGEQVVVTTYDQVVCGTPGLPLSFSLRAGHAVAGALLMSRLVLDEAHLAWGISKAALSVLLGMVGFRRRLGRQTILLSATLPRRVAQEISAALEIELVVAGEGETADDAALAVRDANRTVYVRDLHVSAKTGRPDLQRVWREVAGGPTKAIYFANTVERLQEAYDYLCQAGTDPSRITVLHNRMPRSWRTEAEAEARSRFGKASPPDPYILLTNQVAEAGLDISAPTVFTDAAPVDTLVQRAGRCARWFREQPTEGTVHVVTTTKGALTNLAGPYRQELVALALDHLPQEPLTWDIERSWVDQAWGLGPDKAQESLREALAESDFALNLLDRAAQSSSPGEIARVFREIVSVEVAVAQPTGGDLLTAIEPGWAVRLRKEQPETCSLSLAQGVRLLRNAQGNGVVVRCEDGEPRFTRGWMLRPGDLLVVPPQVAFLSKPKGLCLGDGTKAPGAILESDWRSPSNRGPGISRGGSQRQTLLQHTLHVMEGTYRRLLRPGAYSDSLRAVLSSLAPGADVTELCRAVAQLACVAAAFHDLGKADERWQQRARAIDPGGEPDLIGRTQQATGAIGLPHTPPAFAATVLCARLLIGDSLHVRHLIRAVALASARHHSSLLNPATTAYQFQPHPDCVPFVRSILMALSAPDAVIEEARSIVEGARLVPKTKDIPSLLPNDDLFGVYALVGRAILVSDRESASGQSLEWLGRTSVGA